jgi:alkyl hydroperoxide reductase subunit AhpC
MITAMVATGKVMRKAQEDDVYMGRRGCEVSVVSMD